MRATHRSYDQTREWQVKQWGKLFHERYAILLPIGIHDRKVVCLFASKYIRLAHSANPHWPPKPNMRLPCKQLNHIGVAMHTDKNPQTTTPKHFPFGFSQDTCLRTEQIVHYAAHTSWPDLLTVYGARTGGRLRNSKIQFKINLISL